MSSNNKRRKWIISLGFSEAEADSFIEFEVPNRKIEALAEVLHKPEPPTEGETAQEPEVEPAAQVKAELGSELGSEPAVTEPPAEGLHKHRYTKGSDICKVPGCGHVRVPRKKK